MVKSQTKQFVVILIIVVSLIATAILVQQNQFLGTKADIDVTNAFVIKDSNGQTLNCENNICETTTLDVTIELKDANQLAQ